MKLIHHLVFIVITVATALSLYWYESYTQGNMKTPLINLPKNLNLVRCS
jgi:hypothetical protein